jgi:hypothetical protein
MSGVSSELNEVSSELSGVSSNQSGVSSKLGGVISELSGVSSKLTDCTHLSFFNRTYRLFSEYCAMLQYFGSILLL